MPQVDLSSVCGGGGGGSIGPERKVACETTADERPPLDYAPESFFVSRDSELDWLDQNAYIERKNSGKGPTGNPNPNSNSMYGSSQRQLKSKASILALPKPQKGNYGEGKNRRSCKPPTIRLFPKRSDSSGRKPASSLSEPSSPKVSCMGRVRSKKDRRNHHGDTNIIKKTNSGFWNNLRTLFKSKGDKIGCKGTQPDAQPVVPRPKSKSKKGTNPRTESESESESEPPALGAMNRFASGRRSDAWAAEIQLKSEPLDQSPIWHRRQTEAPQDVGVDRDWHSVGRATV